MQEERQRSTSSTSVIAGSTTSGSGSASGSSSLASSSVVVRAPLFPSPIRLHGGGGLGAIVGDDDEDEDEDEDDEGVWPLFPSNAPLNKPLSSTNQSGAMTASYGWAENRDDVSTLEGAAESVFDGSSLDSVDIGRGGGGGSSNGGVGGSGVGGSDGGGCGGGGVRGAWLPLWLNGLPALRERRAWHGAATLERFQPEMARVAAANGGPAWAAHYLEEIRSKLEE